jgi:hypothetical protein
MKDPNWFELKWHQWKLGFTVWIETIRDHRVKHAWDRIDILERQLAALIHNPHCPHSLMKIAEATVHDTAWGYQYLVVNMHCVDCAQDWKLQARTPGKFSSHSNSDVFVDASLSPRTRNMNSTLGRPE